LFSEDKEIVVFRSPGEAETKIAYYLQREEERMRITERLKEKIMGNYLLEHTVAKINELLLKL
jgi:spore maturation protein CgeB